jgi:hypothetical protein
LGFNYITGFYVLYITSILNGLAANCHLILVGHPYVLDVLKQPDKSPLFS